MILSQASALISLKLNYNDLAYEIIKIYTGNAFSKNELKKIIKNSYKEL